MDLYGIGTAIKAAVGFYTVIARRTGRTTTMVNSLKPGDRVIFFNYKDTIIVKTMCRTKGIVDIKFEVHDPRSHEIFAHGPSRGRTIFDHRWVEEYYLGIINDAVKRLDNLQTQLSGYGEEHIKTKMQAESMYKFNPWSNL